MMDDVFSTLGIEQVFSLENTAALPSIGQICRRWMLKIHQWVGHWLKINWVALRHVGTI